MTTLLTRRHALGLTAATIASAIVPARAAEPPRPVVVELFTSQGCSSCPPADAFMQELIQDKGVIALSYHVDYWDYLGWKDTLGKADFSRRQYAYAKARGDMDVYTPQMVVDGGKHYVGSHRDDVRSAVAKRQAAADLSTAALSIAARGGEIEFTAGAAEGGPPCTLWLISAAPEVKVRIERGENAGSTIVYRNVVRSLTPAGMWKGKAMSGRLPRDSVAPAGAALLVALLQQDNAGPIHAAAAARI